MDLYLTGSLVNTWESQYATAPWQWGGEFFMPPDRYFLYDLAFNNVADLPPFTPVVVTAENVAVW